MTALSFSNRSNMTNNDNDNNDMVYTSLSSTSNNNNNTHNNGDVVDDGDVAVGRGGVGRTENNIQVIPSMHMDYIHQVALDVYGRRMATCSGDRFVRIWELSSSDGNWILVAQWQAHRGSISSICWAHPEFGNLLATCGSSDHDAKIWEEMTPPSMSSSSTSTSNVTSNSASAAAGAVNGSFNNNPISTLQQQQQQQRNSWTAKASLTEARRAVTCCEFAPRHWGLKIAIGSADGNVRIYEAVDIMNLAQWPLAATLQCFSNDPNDSSNNTNVSSNKGMGGSSTGSNKNSSSSSLLYKTSTNAAITSGTNSSSSKDIGCTSVSWCTGRFEPPTLVVAGKQLVVFRYSEAARAWQIIMQLSSNSGVGGGSSIPPASLLPSRSHVLDVSWAPNVGRRFHYIAAAEEDTLRIYKITRQQHDGSSAESDVLKEKQQQQQQPQYALSLEDVQVITTNAWRCQWNVTGTVLASSGDGGIVQLWKADHFGRFGCVGKVQGDRSSYNTSGGIDAE
jgi:nucleoporin SEH1